MKCRPAQEVFIINFKAFQNFMLLKNVLNLEKSTNNEVFWGMWTMGQSTEHDVTLFNTCRIFFLIL